jgi:hypothetical protein
MTDITAFPAESVLVANDKPIIGGIEGPTQTFKFAAAAKAGQVVVYVTGTSGSVTPATGAVSELVAGVAINNVASGAVGTVAMAGCIVQCVNADDTTAITPGAWVQTNDNAVKGTVSAIAFTGTESTLVTQFNVVGITHETIAGAGSGYVLLMPVPLVNKS